jgi:hypothetical protein
MIGARYECDRMTQEIRRLFHDRKSQAQPVAGRSDAARKPRTLQDRLRDTGSRIAHLQDQMTSFNIAVNTNLTALGVANCIRDHVIHNDGEQIGITLHHGNRVDDSKPETFRAGFRAPIVVHLLEDRRDIKYVFQRETQSGAIRVKREFLKLIGKPEDFGFRTSDQFGRAFRFGRGRQLNDTYEGLQALTKIMAHGGHCKGQACVVGDRRLQLGHHSAQEITRDADVVDFCLARIVQRDIGHDNLPLVIAEWKNGSGELKVASALEEIIDQLSIANIPCQDLRMNARALVKNQSSAATTWR